MDKIESDTVRIISVPDSIVWPDILLNDSIFSLDFNNDYQDAHDAVSSDTTFFTIPTPSPHSFKPNPNKAILYSAIFPGLGQIYNRKYWKLPIVYGGFMGFSYAIMWNNKNLQDYGNAYRDLSFDLANNQGDPDSWHQSWKNFVAAGADPATRYNENFRGQLKRGRDAFRRNRDLSIILTVAFYFICMADTYVDAQLFDFDISSDLSLHIEPVINPGTGNNARLYGLNCSIKF